jgi:phenylpyruvate tautomerase PptA (4-oxalocrotonate tautomerase family)
MPFVRVTSFPQTQEAKAEIAQGVTEVVHRVTKVPTEYILGGFRTDAAGELVGGRNPDL